VPRPAYRDSTACAQRVNLASGFHHCSSIDTAFPGNPVWSQRSSVSSSDTPPFRGLYGRSSVCSGLVIAAWSVDDCPCYCAYNTTMSVLFPGPVAPPGRCLRQIKVTAMRTYYSSSAFLGCSVFTRLAVCGGGCDGPIVRATKEEACRLRNPNHLNKT
jgi:hypothetical protein